VAELLSDQTSALPVQLYFTVGFLDNTSTVTQQKLLTFCYHLQWPTSVKHHFLQL